MMDAEKKAVFEKFFYPESAAVVGASTNEGAFGTRLLSSLLRYGFKGKLYPVNPRADKILGLKAYPSLTAIPDSVDTALICVPAKLIAGVLEDCLKKDIKAAVILTSGFSEVGEEGRALEKELIRIAGRRIRIMGPNCFGVYCPRSGLTLIPGPGFPKESGPVALIAQSGQFSETIISQSKGMGVRFSKAISYGNAADINEADLLEYLADDDETKVIMAYIEGVKDGRRFFDAVRRVSRSKPVIIWKSGLTQMGKRAASSHTGSLAGNKEVWDAFFRQSGAVRVNSDEELIEATVAFLSYPSGCGPRVGLISGGGGGMVAGSDLCENLGLAMPALSDAGQAKLRSLIEAVGTSVRNPVDMSNPTPSVPLLTAVTETVASSEQIDVIVLRRLFLSVKGGKMAIGHSFVPEEEEKQLMDIPVKIKERFGKPVVVMLQEELVGSTDMEFEADRRKLRDFYFAHGIPTYTTLEQTIRSVAHLARYRENAQRVVDKSAAPGRSLAVNRHPIIEEARRASRTLLTEVESKTLLSEAGIPVVETRLAMSKEEAVAISEKLGYPVVLKIVSTDITHKSDVGGVKLGLKTPGQVAQACDEIFSAVSQKYPEAAINGVSVQKMARPGVEVIVGMTRDAQFGPVLMFGIGGILVEVLKDVSFRIVPLDREDARAMIREIKGYPLLKGYRGTEPVDISGLEEILLKLSGFVEDHPEIKELDLNPVFAYKDGAVAVDARVILETNPR